MTVVLKAIEELNELGVVLAKMAYVDGFDYWGGRDLRPEFIEELGDVYAILGYIFDRQSEEMRDAVLARIEEKAAIYKEWWG